MSVPAGTYGWSINVSATTAMIVASVKAGQDLNKEIVHNGSGYSTDGDIGNTYVEVSKEKQHEWYIKDGKVVMDSDIVTGKPGQDTPSGVFYVWSKQRNATLRGKTTMAATTPVLFRTGCQLITPGSASTIVRGSLSTAATGTRNTDRMAVSTTRQTSWQSCMPQLTKARL